MGQPIPPAKPSRAPRVEAEPEVDIVEALPAPTIHETAQKLIVSGYLPPPFSIDPLDGRPVWSFTELAAMFNRRPDELVDLLIDAGPVHLAADKGVPSSWRALIERYG